MSEAIAGLLKVIYDPTQALKATLQPLTSVDIPLAHHTVSVIKGRAYLFGGKTSNKDDGSEDTLAGNEVHVVILPSSGVESTDYKKVDATADAPSRRYGHSAAVIEDRIYVFGGCGTDGEPLGESGKVFVFDTVSNSWSHLDPPADSPAPQPRANCAMVASEHPRRSRAKPDEWTLPQDPPDPDSESMMPDIPATDTYGSLIVQGGQSKGGKHTNDVWTFDISSRTWKELPEPPLPTVASPSLSLRGRRLYTFLAGQTSYLDLTASSFNDRGGKGELGLAPLGPWESWSPSSSSPEKPYPGQGRNYLLLVGGDSQAGETLEDIWTLQLNPEGMTAASFKDAARMAISKDTGESQWEEVRYANSEGVIIQEGQPDRGIGRRRGFAAAKEVEMDGASIVLWGGIGADERPRGDGLMITIGS
ncbi:hypothetical protein LTR37_008813 [Vermiconidia calcicola]|uniref:Uncharacterized protein n=1 Tax=Vermiconidia calcicola TaxID=1690605 RepID=A0ACC3NA37_9PEZI|nr:hypothetical protein LTR37_008813 [Vermiconidia calcicola]